VRFVGARAKTLRPPSVKVLTVALRSLLRFLQLEGRVKATALAAVPSLSAWERFAAPHTLSRSQIADLLRSFDRAAPLGRRDYAMTLCMVELGLRLSEVAQLSLDDLDWRQGTLRLVKNKTGRERLLPLPHRVEKALVGYLRRGRPTVAQTPQVQRILAIPRKRWERPLVGPFAGGNPRHPASSPRHLLDGSPGSPALAVAL